MKTIVVGLLLMLVSAGAAQTQGRHSTGQRQVNWRPVPFPGNVSSLSANYKGNDAVRFYRTLAANAGRLQKGEFETTADYEIRMRDLTRLLAPIDPSAIYAFRLDTTAKYDADRQVYVVGFRDAYNCTPSSFLENGPATLFCKIAEEFTPGDDYIGQNSFGATTTVRQIHGQTVSLAISRVAIKQSGTFWPIDTVGDYSLVHEIALPLAKARSRRADSVGVLLVGKLTSAKLIQGSGLYNRPTFSDPVDIEMPNAGMPFELSSIVFYVVETGQILDTIKVDASENDWRFDPVPGDVAGTDDQRQNFIESLKTYVGTYYRISPQDVQLGQTTVWHKADQDGVIVCIDEGTYLLALSVPTNSNESVATKIVNKTGRDQHLCNTPGGTQLLPHKN